MWHKIVFNVAYAYIWRKDKDDEVRAIAATLASVFTNYSPFVQRGRRLLQVWNSSVQVAFELDSDEEQIIHTDISLSAEPFIRLSTMATCDKRWFVR